MSAPLFQKAERRAVKVKLGVTGPSGAGKTFSALRLARGIAGQGKIAFIDTENGSASLYSDRFDFDVINLDPPFTPDKYVEAINAAVTGGYSVVVIDSFSHAWEQVLEKKTAMDARGGNSFTNWGVAGKDLKTILTQILQSDIHIVAAMRSKTEYSQEKDEKTGKTVVKKLGLAPIMRDGIEYEFSVVFDVAMNHEAATSKDRTGLFSDKLFQITEKTGEQILAWLHQAKPAPAPAPSAATAPAAVAPAAQAADQSDLDEFEKATPEQVEKINLYIKNETCKPMLPKVLAKANVTTVADLSKAQAEKTILWMQDAMNKAAKGAAA